MLFLSVSVDFESNKMLNVTCFSEIQHSAAKRFSLEVKDEDRSNCVSKLGIIMINSNEEWPTGDKIFYLLKNHATSIQLKPKIVRTDESLRILSPKK